MSDEKCCACTNELIRLQRNCKMISLEFHHVRIKLFSHSKISNLFFYRSAQFHSIVKQIHIQQLNKISEILELARSKFKIQHDMISVKSYLHKKSLNTRKYPRITTIQHHHIQTHIIQTIRSVPSCRRCLFSQSIHQHRHKLLNNEKSRTNE